MSSGFSGGYSGGGPEFYNYAGGRSSRLPSNNNPHLTYRSNLAAPLSFPDSGSSMLRNRDLTGKRSLAEFQQQHLLLQLQKQQYENRQEANLGVCLRNVKPRMYQQASPISPLSPMDFSPFLAPSNSLEISPVPIGRYGIPVFQPVRQMLPMTTNNMINNNVDVSSSSSCSNGSFPNSAQKHAAMLSSSSGDSEKNMMFKLQELEKELFDDNDEGDHGRDVSVVTNSEWSDETIQSLINPTHKSISPSPTSSSSSCSSTSASGNIIACPKQSIIDAASAISEGKPEVALEILTRLTHVSNLKGTSEQRLTAYVASALRSRVSPTRCLQPVSELFSKEHSISAQMLYKVSPCFKLGFMAANLAILEATTSTDNINKLHIIDFDIGHGGQYVHLLHALAASKDHKLTVLKITAFKDFVGGGEERVKVVGDKLKELSEKVGLSLIFNVMGGNMCDLNHEKLGLDENGEALAVNFAFRLYKLPDESVTTDNLRDGLLRRVKKLSPKVVTVVEQEMNGNTAPFLARVNEVCGYYGALFDSLDSTMSRESLERVQIEEGLGRKVANSVACEGRDRIERCEVFGKWRARMSMAGFEPKPMSQLVADSLRSKLNCGALGNPGFTVNEQNGGVCFGWMGRTLTVASAWH